MKRGLRGYTLVEICVVLGIVAFIAALTMVRLNLYKARHACKSAAQVLMSDIKLQQQKAFTLEREQVISIAPGGNLSMYKVKSSEPDTGTRVVNFKNLFSAGVKFAPGQEDKELIFYPWTAKTPGEWSVVQSNSTNNITIQGGDLSCVINITPEGKLKLLEMSP